MKHPFISRVEINNFRNFNKFAVELEPTAVIVGENKAGKSNFLDALRLVLDPSLPDSARKLRAEDFWDGLDQSFAGHTIEVKIFIRDFEENEGAKAILSDCVVESSPLTAQLTYQFRPVTSIESTTGEAHKDARLNLSEDDYDFVVYGGTEESNLIGSEVRKWLALVLLPALRDAEGDIQNWRKSPLRPLLERVRKQIPAKHFAAVRDELDNAKAKLLQAKPVAKLVKSVNERVRNLAGPVHCVETDLDFASSEPEHLIKSLRVYLREKTSKPLSDASLGTANILFLALLLQDMEMKQQAREIVSTILAIEEPEAHLHPQLQRLLFRYFLSRRHPILLTTHSPNIASVAPIDSIVLLRDVAGETRGFTPRDLALNEQQTADLQRYLDVTRAEVLFARAVILVEGVAEQFLIPAFASSYLKTEECGCSSLDDLGISICSVNGTDFVPFKRLLSDNGLSIPSAVITDGDPITDGNSKVQYAGLKRGLRLLDKKHQPAIQALLENNEPGDATDVLGKHGVFVGYRTLEIDLAETLAAEMKATYQELRNSTTASAKFDAAVDAIARDSDDEQAATDMLIRIEAIGKGRFAQRLASKVEDKSPPDYIRHALEYVVNLTRPADAKTE